jgi:hypothetical protein
MIKRPKLNHHYHDAIIFSVEYRGKEDIVFHVSLCSCGNPSPGPATLSFLGVRNLEDVRSALEDSRRKNCPLNRVDEIIGIGRTSPRGYILDLATAGSLHIDADGVLD